MRAARLAAGLWRAEGPRAILDRLRDRGLDAARRRSFREVDLARFAAAGPWTILHLLGRPPWRRLGGVQQHALERWPHEAALAAPAALYPEPGPGGRWRLEGERAGRRLAVRLAGPSLAPGPEAHRDGAGDGDGDSDSDRALAPFLRDVVERLGCPAPHVEGFDGWPLGALADWARDHPPLVTLHDFTAICERSHLLEATTGIFCDACADLERCGRCLAAARGRGTDPAAAAGMARRQARRREAAGEILRRARAVFFVSDYLRAVHHRFFDLVALATSPLIQPSPPWPAPPAAPPSGRSGANRVASSLRVAFAGRFVDHKGARVVLEVAERLRVRSPAAAVSRATAPVPISVSVWGGGDRAALLVARRLGIAVRGYYAAGTLPARLQAAGIDVALLPAVAPEPFGRTLEEAAAAGIPSIVLDHGAMADRVRAHGLGWTVPLPAAGAAEAIAALLARCAAEPDTLAAARARVRAFARTQREAVEPAARRAARALLERAAQGAPDRPPSQYDPRQ